MPTRRLSAAALARSAKALREKLGKADHDRSDRLIELIGEDGAINLGRVLESLYPGSAREAALTGFRQFRARLKAAALEAGLELELVVDTQTRVAPHARRAWFEANIIAGELPAVSRNLASPEPTKRAIPVALKRVLFDGTIDLKGLERLQVFHDCSGKAFAERSTAKTRDDFACELFRQIVRVVAQQTQPPASSEPQAGSRVEAQLHRHIEEFGVISFVPTRGFASSLEKLEPERREDAPAARGDALDYLMDWVSNPESQSYCALLGDLGFGKTMTCIAFAKRLLDARGGDPSLPRPIFLDLRHPGEMAAREPDLMEILTQVLKQSWRSGSAGTPLAAQDIIRLVQEEGALAIFDGLDEVLVHLSPGAGQRFTRQLFHILPPSFFGLRAPRAPGVLRGRLLLSCRTHYFRTLRDQKTHFTGEGREGIRPDDFRGNRARRPAGPARCLPAAGERADTTLRLYRRREGLPGRGARARKARRRGSAGMGDSGARGRAPESQRGRVSRCQPVRGAHRAHAVGPSRFHPGGPRTHRAFVCPGGGQPLRWRDTHGYPVPRRPSPRRELPGGPLPPGPVAREDL